MNCERCGKSDIEEFASAYRKMQLKNGRPDPGNLCPTCAGSDTGKRIAAEVLKNG